MLPWACKKTLERIGSVVRVLTTFCTCCKPSSNFSLLALNFIVVKPRLRCKAVDFVRQLESACCHYKIGESSCAIETNRVYLCSELSMKEIVGRRLSCSVVLFFTSLHAGRRVKKRMTEQDNLRQTISFIDSS